MRSRRRGGNGTRREKLYAAMTRIVEDSVGHVNEARLMARARGAVVAAARLEHQGVCARRPRPEDGFLGACNICARLADLDAIQKADDGTEGEESGAG